MPEIDEQTLALLSALGSIGQVVTALVAALIAGITYKTAASFNRGQATKFQVEHINEINRHIAELALHDQTLARQIGRPVLADSNIVADYTNFMFLNYFHMSWTMWKEGIFTLSEFRAKADNTAAFFVRYGEDYVDALLARGYETPFVSEVKAAIQRIGGYPASDTAATDTVGNVAT